MNVKQTIIHFLSTPSLATFESAKQYLVSIRHELIQGYNMKESRMLWFSLLMYKFRQDQNTPDELWDAARTFILNTLRDQPSEESAREFITRFSNWKETDFTSFVNEIIGYYLQVLHLKETIEETKEEETVQEWRDSYQCLLLKIRGAAEKMGCLHQLDERVRQVHELRHTIVSSVMRRAYWDMLEDDVRHQRYETVICQLVELKDLVRSIIQAVYHLDLDEKFNIEYVKERIETQSFDQAYLVGLCRWVMETMKEWDSETACPMYEREIETWERAISTLEWPTLIRFSLELCTVLALDAKTRISVWRTVINRV